MGLAMWAGQGVGAGNTQQLCVQALGREGQEGPSLRSGGYSAIKVPRDPQVTRPWAPPWLCTPSPCPPQTSQHCQTLRERPGRGRLLQASHAPHRVLSWALGTCGAPLPWSNLGGWVAEPMGRPAQGERVDSEHLDTSKRSFRKTTGQQE